MADIQSLDDLIAAKPEEINPFRLLGIEPWVLRSMSFEDLRNFISDFKKVIARYHHPDIHVKKSESEKLRHGTYFKLFNSAVDRLLEDEFYFRQSLDRLSSGGIIQQYERKVEVKDREISTLKAEIANLKDVAQSDILRYGCLYQALANIVEIQNQMLSLPGSYPFSLGRSCKLRFGEVSGSTDYPLNYALSDLFASSHSHLDLEEEGRKIVKRESKERYFQGEEDRPKGKSASTSRKQHPSYEVPVQDRNFVKIVREGKRDEKYCPMEIMGSLPFNALKEYLNYYGKKLITPKDHGAVSTETCTIEREFMFSSQFGEDYRHFLGRINPFLSLYAFPNTFLLTREVKSRYGKEYEYFGLIVPINITHIK